MVTVLGETNEKSQFCLPSPGKIMAQVLLIFVSNEKLK